ncbi:MAG: Fe-S oxidoreductase [Candidatus Cloacimonadota bacterium]|nr:MAG: Fe-S oxidoreductase [Candidatus Cloacimonadota bacterium]
MALKIKEVPKGSIAYEAGILPDMMILSVNGETVRDFIDLQFLTSEDFLEIEVQHNNERKKFFLENDFVTPVGLIPAEHKCRTCANHCIFCFVDQMRPNSRKSLHFKDDDHTFSFFFGNFITLTNMSSVDFDKIISQGRSPLYVSVHTANPVLHKKMLRYKHDFNIRESLSRLNEAGINLHTQIVLIPGWNDDEELISTLRFLTGLESVLSVGIVPVGITKYRDGLTKLNLTTKEQAEKAIRTADYFNSKEEEPRIFCSDEFYILAEREVPGSDFYMGFDQLENGIGMIRFSMDNWEEYKEDFLAEIALLDEKIIFITSQSPAKFIKSVVDEINDNFETPKCEARVIKNNYLGDSVTVAGLISASDIFEQVPVKKKELLVLPSSIFNDDMLTIDQITKMQITEHYGNKLLIMNSLFDGWEFETAGDN